MFNYVQLMTRILFCVALIFSSFSGIGQVAYAAEADYEWEENDDGTVKITNYIGSASDIVIPSQIDGKDVTVIAYAGTGAFGGKGLTSVQIPEGVKEIEQWAFANNELTSITFPNSLEILGGLSFANNKLTEVTIPPNINVIRNSVFSGNELTTIHLHDGIEEIQRQAFLNNQLSSITISDHVHTIGDRAFGSNPLESIDVHPDNPNFKDIDQKGLYTKDGKEILIGTRSMDIDSDTEIIGQSAFNGVGLSGEIVIPEHIREIKGSAFQRNEITSVTVLNKDVIFSGPGAFNFQEQIDNIDITIKADHASTARVFAEQHGHTFIAISGAEADYEWEENDDGTVKITNYIGSDSDIMIPSQIDGKDVTVIAYDGTGAFGGKGLTSVQIPEGVKEIEQWAFANNELTSITFPNTLEILGGLSFANNKLTEVTIPPNINVIRNSVFSGNELTSIHLHDGIEEIQRQAFLNNQLSSITISDHVHTIGDRAFGSNPLESIDVHPDNPNFKDIDQKGLYTKDGKEILIGTRSMDIDSDTEIIGQSAFNGVGLSGDIVIPEHIQEIKGSAFQRNEITSVTVLNKDVIFSGPGAFNFQEQIDNIDITIKADHASTARVFAAQHGHTFIAISGTEDEYEWVLNEDSEGNFLDTVTIINYIGFETDITIPEKLDGKKVTTIGEEAFQNKGLTSVNIPQSVHTIAERAFQNNLLTMIDIPESVQEIGDAAFRFNDLTEVLVHSEQVSFGENLFADNQNNSKDLTIKGHDPSTAKTYAEENDHSFLPFVTPGSPDPGTPGSGSEEDDDSETPDPGKEDDDDSKTPGSGKGSSGISPPLGSGGGKNGGSSSEEDHNGDQPDEQDTVGDEELAQPSEQTVVTFDDLVRHWAKMEIELLASKGIIKGIDEHHFAPSRPINRAEFTALLVRSLGLEASSSTDLSFRDVKAGVWYEQEVQIAVDAGLISGYPDHTFRPEKNISREELAVLMHRAAAYVNQDTGNFAPEHVLGSYQDVNDVSPWALQAMAYSVEHGIIRGITEFHLAPDKEATRAEAAVMLYRLLSILNLLTD